MKKHLDLLGFKASDKVTGFKGVITTVSFDLYGCVQAVITPESREGKVLQGHWFDINRLNIESEELVMSAPDFESGYIAEGKKGCAIKPTLEV